jgi:hypothetical protein
MAAGTDSIPETDLTDEDGISGREVIEAFEEVAEDDEAPNWEHWRTSPNYTCMYGDAEWLFQVGRHDPILSVMHLGKGIEGSVIIDSPANAFILMVKGAEDPKHALVQVLEQSDADNIDVRKYDVSASPKLLTAAQQRQEIWGDRATKTETETPNRENKGDVDG